MHGIISDFLSNCESTVDLILEQEVRAVYIFGNRKLTGLEVLKRKVLFGIGQWKKIVTEIYKGWRENNAVDKQV